MNWKIRTVLAASLGLSSSVGACRYFQTTATDAGLDGGGGRASGKAGLAPRTLGASVGTGTVGTNGLDPDVFWSCITELTAHMGAPLLADAGSVLRPEFSDILEPVSGSTCDPNSDQGVMLVQHAIGCALPNNQQLTYTYQNNPKVSIVLTADGILDNDTGVPWLTTVLSVGDQQDVLTCMAARLNPLGKTKIWMNGADTNHVVNPDDPDGAAGTTPYSVIEAGWQTIIASDGGVTTTVWPLWERGIEANPKSYARFMKLVGGRLCSIDAGACHIQLNTGKCTWGPDGGDTLMTCADAGNAPILETRLTCKDYCETIKDQDSGTATDAGICTCK